MIWIRIVRYNKKIAFSTRCAKRAKAQKRAREKKKKKLKKLKIKMKNCFALQGDDR